MRRLSDKQTGDTRFILDDYIPLWYLTSETLSKKEVLFPLYNAYFYNKITYVHTAWDNYPALNPPFGTGFTYYLHDNPGSQDIENPSEVVRTVVHAGGKEMRKIMVPATAGQD